PEARGLLDGRLHVVRVAREEHAERLDLVHRGVGGVEPARHPVEAEVAREAGAEGGGEVVEALGLGGSVRHSADYTTPVADRSGKTRQPGFVGWSATRRSRGTPRRSQRMSASPPAASVNSSPNQNAAPAPSPRPTS